MDAVAEKQFIHQLQPLPISAQQVQGKRVESIKPKTKDLLRRNIKEYSERESDPRRDWMLILTNNCKRLSEARCGEIVNTNSQPQRVLDPRRDGIFQLMGAAGYY